jgi:hypothetical protein
MKRNLEMNIYLHFLHSFILSHFILGGYFTTIPKVFNDFITPVHDLFPFDFAIYKIKTRKHSSRMQTPANVFYY